MLSGIANAECPYARRARQAAKAAAAKNARSENRTFTFETTDKRCPRGQHIFKGNCVDNKILDEFPVCTETNCTENCPGCRKESGSCLPRPDNKDIYVCIECRSNKNCKPGYLCKNYRCVAVNTPEKENEPPAPETKDSP